MLEPNYHSPTASVNISQRANEPSLYTAITAQQANTTTGNTSNHNNEPELLNALRTCVHIIQTYKLTMLPQDAIPLVNVITQLIPGNEENMLHNTLRAINQKIDGLQSQVNNLVEPRPTPYPNANPAHHAPHTFTQVAHTPATTHLP